VCLGLAVAALALSGVVSAATLIGPETRGSTSISSGGCSASVTPIPSGNFNVNNGDNVKFYYNFTWSDTRIGSPPVAKHYFNMTISYTRMSGDISTEEVHYTSGSASGPGSLTLTVYNVYEGEYIGVTGIAQVSLACSAYDADTGVLYLV
jgi:hypothetical protein